MGQANYLSIAQVLSQSLEYHQTGKLKEAAAGYQEILQQNPRHSDALHLLGVIAQQMDQLDMAIELMKAAIAQNPSVAHYHHNLGNTYLKAKQPVESIHYFREAILLKPDYFEAHFGLGTALEDIGQPEIAAEAYQQAIALRPDFAAAHYSLGRMASKLGKIDAAILCYREAVQLDSTHPEYFFNLGNAFQKKKDYSSAIKTYKHSLALQPNDPECLNNLGLVLAHEKRVVEAEEAYRQALTLKPDYVHCCDNLAALLLEQERFEEAVTYFHQAVEGDPKDRAAHFQLGLAHLKLKENAAAEKAFRSALAIDPELIEAQYNLGNIIREDFRLPEAIACYRKVLELTSELSPSSESPSLELKTARFRALCNLALALNEQGEVDSAIEIYHEALKLEPEDARTHCNLAYALLAAGRLPEGFQEHEWRWKLSVNRPRNFDCALWKGEPLHGKAILIHAEQGLGDTIQYIRYLPMVAERGGRVILDVPQSLCRLFHGLPGADQIIPTGGPLPEFSWHCPLMSLPLIFGTTLETIPASDAYLFLPREEIDIARGKWPGEGLRVGIAWSGNPVNPTDVYRSTSLERMMPLSTIPGVSFYSLQVGKGADQVMELAHSFPIVDVCSRFTDFADTAAFIAGLDLVITVDTAVAHLAGALGIPVWILIAHCRSDWRWFRERSDNPWYPTARIFRQPEPGDWSGTIEMVKVELARIVTDPLERDSQAESALC